MIDQMLLSSLRICKVFFFNVVVFMSILFPKLLFHFSLSHNSRFHFEQIVSVDVCLSGCMRPRIR